MNHKRLESILIHTDCDHADKPLAEHLQDGNSIEWSEGLAGAWAWIALVGCVLGKLLN